MYCSETALNLWQAARGVHFERIEEPVGTLRPSERVWARRLNERKYADWQNKSQCDPVASGSRQAKRSEHRPRAIRIRLSVKRRTLFYAGFHGFRSRVRGFETGVMLMRPGAGVNFFKANLCALVRNPRSTDQTIFESGAQDPERVGTTVR